MSWIQRPIIESHDWLQGGVLWSSPTSLVATDARNNGYYIQAKGFILGLEKPIQSFVDLTPFEAFHSRIFWINVVFGVFR